MGLKDEIDKLVQAERAKLESRDRKHSDYQTRQRERFAPMQKVLQELRGSIEERFLKLTINEDSATLEVGRKEPDYFSTDVRWRIQPNFRVQVTGEKSNSLFAEEAGFRVEETRYYRFSGADIDEKTLVFDDVNAVAEFLIKNVAERIAEYGHQDSLAERRGQKT